MAVSTVLALTTAAVASGAAMLVGTHGSAAPGDPGRPVPAPSPMLAPTAASGPASMPTSMPGSGSATGMPYDLPSGTGPSGAVPPGVGSPPTLTPSAVGSGPAPWSAADCATLPIRTGGGSVTDDGTALVPPGATSVTRCETPLATGGAIRPAPPRVLTTGVDEFVALLNSLPPVPLAQGCLPVILPVQLSFVFTLPETQPLVVVLDPACSALVTGGRAKSYATLNPLPVFDSLFDAQASAPPGVPRHP